MVSVEQADVPRTRGVRFAVRVTYNDFDRPYYLMKGMYESIEFAERQADKFRHRYRNRDGCQVEVVQVVPVRGDV